MRKPMQNSCGCRARRWMLAALLCALGSLAAAADPATTLRVAFSSAEMSFDPQFSADAASDGVIDHVYDSMLDYDYLVRPVKLVPRTLEAMPTIEDNGATYVFKLKHGIFFTPDPAFKGMPRELTAADQAYALKRLLDPAVKSPWLWLIEGKIVGADALRASALKSGKFDYDAPIRGRPALSLCVRGAEHGRRRARGRGSIRPRFRRASGRHRPLHAWRIQTQRKDRAGREPGVSRDDLRSCGTRAAGVDGDRRRA